MTTSSEIQAVTDKYQLVGARDPDTGEIKPVNMGDGTVLGLAVQQYVWNTDTLAWEKAIQPEFSLDGEVKVDNAQLEALVEDTLEQYKLDDYDVSNDPTFYMGYQRKDGYYYIKRINTTTGAVDYTAGTSAYSTAWTNRASESYADFASTF
jgi:hypothetical protein